MEIGAAGIDLLASGEQVHVSAATPAGAARGSPRSPPSSRSIPPQARSFGAARQPRCR